MRVPSSSFFYQEIKTVNKQYQMLSKLSEQASSNQKLTAPSDDPVLSNHINMFKDSIDNLQSYNETGINAQNRTSLFESTINTCISDVNQVKSLISRVLTDTLSDSDRAAIAQDLQGYLTSLLELANIPDSDGQFIFGGTNASLPPFFLQGNQFVYQGGYESTMLDISPNMSIIYNESGYDVFSNINLGNGTYTISASETNTGTAYTTTGTVNSANYVADNYTLSFVLNSANQLAYQVVGVNSGQVIPIPPADAPPFVPGQSISFNGITFEIIGTPAIGDQFQIQPSGTDDVFNSLRNIIETLNTPINNNPAVLAQFHQVLSQAGATFDQVQNQFINYQSNVGSRMSLVNSQIDLNNQFISDQTISLSKLADADQVEVISTLQQQLVGLQSAQLSYMKIQEFLLNILK